MEAILEATIIFKLEKIIINAKTFLKSPKNNAFVFTNYKYILHIFSHIIWSEIYEMDNYMYCIGKIHI